MKTGRFDKRVRGNFSLQVAQMAAVGKLCKLCKHRALRKAAAHIFTKTARFQWIRTAGGSIMQSGYGHLRHARVAIWQHGPIGPQSPESKPEQTA